MCRIIINLSILSILSMLLFFLGCGRAPSWTRGVANNTYYFQGIGSSSSDQGADRASLNDLGMEISGAKVRSSIELIVTESSSSGDKGSGTSFQEHMVDTTSVVIEAALQKGAKVIERWYNPAKNSYYSYAILSRPGTQEKMAAHARSIKLRSLVPGFAQFSKGHPKKGFTVLGSLGFGIAGTVIFNKREDDAIFDRDYNARSQSDFDYYDDRARTFRNATIATGAATAAVYILNVLDGMFSKPAPGANYFSRIEPREVEFITMERPFYIIYRWDF